MVEIVSPYIERQASITEQNLNFASKQLTYALQTMHNAIRKDKHTPAAKQQNPLVSPHTLNKDGTLKMAPSYEWTSGFFPGTMWYMHELTEDEKWAQLAKKFTATVENQKSNKETHDLGFMMYNSFGNGLRLTNNSTYKPVLMESAKSLISRYQPKAKHFAHGITTDTNGDVL